MKFDDNFNFLGKFDTTELLNVLSNETRWDIYTGRQHNFHLHRATKSIPLIWLPNGFSNGKPAKIWKFPDFDNYLLIIDKLIGNLKFPNCTITKMALIKLTAGKLIVPHTDIGDDLILPHRVHLNISGDQVIFKVGDESKLLISGECYEINNTRVHSVNHNGLVDRVNLMIDFMPNEYLVGGIEYIDATPDVANTFNFKI